MRGSGVKKNMENNETTEELTTKELEEGLVRWYETKVMSRLSQTSPTYHIGCPELWTEKHKNEYNWK